MDAEGRVVRRVVEQGIAPVLRAAWQGCVSVFVLASTSWRDSHWQSYEEQVTIGVAGRKVLWSGEGEAAKTFVGEVGSVSRG